MNEQMNQADAGFGAGTGSDGDIGGAGAVSGVSGIGGAGVGSAEGVSGANGSVSGKTRKPHRAPANFSAIVWGIILIKISVLLILHTLNPNLLGLPPETLITTGLIVAGALLILAGVASGLRKTLPLEDESPYGR